MILYIIPGFEETVEDYKWLIDETSKKFEIRFLDFSLEKNTLKSLIETKIERESVVFGFSIGGLIAYKLKLPVKKGVYCSISNILGVDAEKYYKEIEEAFGSKIAKECLDMDYGLPNANEYVVFCGDKEIDPTTSKLPNIEIIKDTGHEFTANYKKAVLDYIL